MHHLFDGAFKYPAYRRGQGGGTDLFECQPLPGGFGKHPGDSGKIDAPGCDFQREMREGVDERRQGSYGGLINAEIAHDPDFDLNTLRNFWQSQQAAPDARGRATFQQYAVA